MTNAYLHFLFLIQMMALFLTFIRFLKGPHPVDRIMCLDLSVLVVAGLMALQTLYFEEEAFLDLVLILSITGFLSTVVFARFIERNLGQKERV